MTAFAKRGLIRAFINIEKSRFEILITVYLDNAWCLVYQLLHQSIVIQGNSAGALFDGIIIKSNFNKAILFQLTKIKIKTKIIYESVLKLKL